MPGAAPHPGPDENALVLGRHANVDARTQRPDVPNPNGQSDRIPEVRGGCNASRHRLRADHLPVILRSRHHVLEVRGERSGTRGAVGVRRIMSRAPRRPGPQS